ncbi:MAG: ABC transporter ATP-binding protein [Isosphaeraceae bacterium]
MMAIAGSTDLTLYRRLLRLMWPFWPHIAGGFLLSLLAGPLALLTPLPLQIAVDGVLGPRPLPGLLGALLPAAVANSDTSILLVAAGLAVAIALATQLQGFASSLLSTYTGERLVLSFRAQLFRHAQRLSLAYHDSKGTADSIYRIQYDAFSLPYLVIDGALPFVAACVTLAGMIYVMIRIDWQLALVALAISPVLLLVSRIYRRRLRCQSQEVKKLESSALAVLQEVLSALRVVKAFGQEDREQERLDRRYSEGMQARLRLLLIEGGFDLIIGLTTAVGMATGLVIGMRHVRSGALTLGQLLLVMGYLSQLYAPLKTIGRKAASVQSHLAGAERACALLDEAPDIAERSQVRPLTRARGDVAFQGVGFGYGDDRPVLRDLSFEIGAGTRVGIAGTTGAGKTTLVSLLTRFYDPTAGQILLDGVDLRDYSLTDLRSQFALVLQETVLFSTSIAENIAYALPGASGEAIVEAAKVANAHEFIARLPRGYATQVGERGMALSGGERQRIALARAFLRDAPILIFDEPTSAVDTRTEAAILEALERLMWSRTTFLIAHRASTLARCDVLLIIEKGRLAVMTSDVSTALREATRPGGRDATLSGSKASA